MLLFLNVVFAHVCIYVTTFLGYDSSALAGYASAAAMQQQQQMRSQQQQGGAPQQGYYGAPAGGLPAPYGAPQGGAYGMYPNANAGQDAGDLGRSGADVSAASAGYAAAAEQQQQQAQQGGGYGAYRGQAAAQGRVDRSYRPY